MRFDNKTRLGTWATLGEAITRFYKRDRLGDEDNQAYRVADTGHWLTEEGQCCLASRHESVTGRALWAQMEGGMVAVYES